jgi:Ca2+-binding RTX toxin-like protein
MKTRPRGRHIDAACAIERLDRRMLLSAVIVHRVLQIRGTGHDDQIELQTDGAQTTVVLGDSRARTFDNGAFDSIVIDGKNGDDSIRISDEIVKPATILGGKGDDYLKGGGGDDVLIDGPGSDTLHGGGNDKPAGVNTADFSRVTTSIQVQAYQILGSDGDVDVLAGYTQRLLTGSGDDSIIAYTGGFDGGINYIDAGPGNDSVSFNSSYGDVTAHGGAGDDEILIYAPFRVGYYYGDAGEDVFSVYRSSSTARDFNGGEGIDTVDYSGVPGGGSFFGVTVTFDDVANDGANEFGQPQPDNVHTDVERLIGTARGNRVFGSENNETIIGSTSNDVIIGGGGNDFLDGGAGNDFIDGQAGADTLIGGDGDDTLIGGPGDDVLDGGAGNNVIIDESRRAISAGRLLDELSGASGDLPREIP